MKQTNTIIIVAVAIILFAGITVGVLSLIKQKDKTVGDSSQSEFGGPGNFGGRGQRPNGMKPTSGTVSAKASDSFTLTTSTGDIKITISSDTRFSKLVDGQQGPTTIAYSDISNGDTVTVMGEKQSDNSIKAQMIIFGTFTPRGDFNNQPPGDNGDGNNNSI